MSKVKSNSVIAYSEDGDVLRFTVADVGTVELDMTKLAPEIVTQAAFYGMRQRIADAAAIPFIKDENRYATPQEKFEAMNALAAHYMTGTTEWKRVGGGGGKEKGGYLLRALMELYPAKTREEVAGFIAGLKPAEKGALEMKPTVKVIIDRMKAERVSAVDAEALLQGL